MLVIDGEWWWWCAESGVGCGRRVVGVQTCVMDVDTVNSVEIFLYCYHTQGMNKGIGEMVSTLGKMVQT